MRERERERERERGGKEREGEERSGGWGDDTAVSGQAGQGLISQGTEVTLTLPLNKSIVGPLAFRGSNMGPTVKLSYDRSSRYLQTASPLPSLLLLPPLQFSVLNYLVI